MSCCCFFFLCVGEEESRALGYVIEEKLDLAVHIGTGLCIKGQVDLAGVHKGHMQHKN